MTLREWLINFDCGYLPCEVWIDGGNDPAYKGPISDIPWFFTELELHNDPYGVTYCDRFDENLTGGFIFTLK